MEEMRKIPHVAVILDGTRRWAKQHNLPEEVIGPALITKMFQVFDWVMELPNNGILVDYVTVYAYSLQNLARSKSYQDKLFKAMELAVENMDNKYLDYFKFVIGGKINLIEENYQRVVKELVEKTKNNKVVLNICVCYDGQEEIVHAVHGLVRSGMSNKLLQEAITVYELSKHMYFDYVPIDMLIRTGFEKRLSGFMPWYIGYAELFFLDCYSIDLQKEDFLNCFEEYFRRSRRFGV